MTSRSEIPPWWRNRRYLPWLVQGGVALVIGVVVAFLLTNLLLNLTARGMLLSWSWLGQPAGFDLAETILPFDASLPYWRAMLAGLVNTLRVVIAGLVGATVLGTLIGTASFSSNGLLRKLARVYVEVIRNIPLLLQLIFWYFVVFLALPNGRDALHLPGIVLAKSGLFLGSPELVDGVWQAPLRFTVEFGALLTGLVVYTAAFIAEVVRGGVASVPRGQWEAATSLGFSPPAYPAADSFAPSLPRDCARSQQPVHLPGQEFLTGSGLRLHRSLFSFGNHPQPDRPGRGGDADPAGLLSGDRLGDLSPDERAQWPCAAERTLKWQVRPLWWCERVPCAACKRSSLAADSMV